MGKTRRVLVHDRGPALWPDHKPLDEVLALEATTPPLIWQGTYQGNPTAPGGHTFKRSWWTSTRFDMWQHTARRLVKGEIVARFQSWDTANKTNEDNAYTSCITADLMYNYTLRIIDMWYGRVELPDLTAEIKSQAKKHSDDGKLRKIVIEDRASGTSALQTLAKDAPPEIASLLQPFDPVVDKVARANQAAVWCMNGSVWLPQPGERAMLTPWLYDFEDDLFNFPQITFLDKIDAFSQLLIFCENLLSAGWQARSRSKGELD